MARVLRITASALAVAAVAACSESPVESDIAPSGTPSFSAARQAPEAVVAGDVIVKLRAGANAESVLGRFGLTRGETGYAGTYIVAHGAVGSEHANARALRADPQVEYAEPNYLRTPDAIDPRLWAFFNPGGLNMTFTRGSSKGAPLPAQYVSKADADMDNVEGYAASGSAVIVGSIDTGVDLLHPELSGRLVAGRDWYSNDSDPSDTDGHGTHTTGTMAGSSVGVAGVSGAAANVKVYVQRVCGQRGCPTSAIVNAIRAAADVPGMVAVNVSIGGASLSQTESDAIAYAKTKGVLVIASAGNDGVGTVSCPACDPNAISVGATNWRDVLTSYSQWGPGLDIVAPGGECYSNTTAEGCIYSSYKGGGYAWLQGTSMAAPQVTGTAAIVASVTGLRGDALRARLIGTTDDLGAPGYDETFGAGRLNSYRAVTNGSAPTGF
jgi:serine protease